MPHLCNSISVLIYCNVTSLFKYAKTFKEKPTHKRDPYNDIKPMEKRSPFMAPLFYAAFSRHKVIRKPVFTCTWTKNTIYYITNNVPISISYMITPRLHQSHAGP